MHDTCEKRLDALENKQTEHEKIIDRVVFTLDDMRKSVDEIKGYMKNALMTIIVTAITILGGGIATLLWLGFRAVLKLPNA